ncbi:MAG: DNA-3-methyladenine glycosylase 2 family protein [Blastocatellia bacterium]
MTATRPGDLQDSESQPLLRPHNTTLAGSNGRGPISSLTEEALTHGVRVLCRRDLDLRGVVKQFGPPPLWAREPGFSTLIHIILEQQVSLASARAAHNRLIELARPLTPRRFLKFDDATLKACGFSRQKAAYCRHLAESIIKKTLDVDALASMEDAAVKAELEKIKGIGRWTSDIYLLMVLRRPDIWPRGDLALATAAREVKQLERRPSYDELDSLSEAWKPWRAVAARILWHHYLSRRA